MSAQDWVLLILVGGLFGTVGQGVRVIVGLKKVYDQALQDGTHFSNLFSTSTLLFSLLVGFVAGVLGMLGIPELNATRLRTDQVVTLIGIGYAGSDFIEGFVRKNTARFTDTAATDNGATSALDSPEQPAVG